MTTTAHRSRTSLSSPSPTGAASAGAVDLPRALVVRWPVAFDAAGTPGAIEMGVELRVLEGARAAAHTPMCATLIAPDGQHHCASVEIDESLALVHIEGQNGATGAALTLALQARDEAPSLLYARRPIGWGAAIAGGRTDRPMLTVGRCAP